MLNPTGANTYTGVTNLVRGILSIGKNNALPAGTILDVDFASAVTDAGTFDLAGFNQEIGGLRDTAATNVNGLVRNSGGGTSTLTINNAADFVYDGSISGDITVTKKGAGAQTLRGALNFPTLNGDAGTTILKSVLGTGTSTINANADVKIGVSQTLAALNIGPGGVVTLDSALPSPAPEFDGGFGGAEALAAGAGAVPEPVSAALLFGGILTLLGVRRNRRCEC